MRIKLRVPQPATKAHEAGWLTFRTTNVVKACAPRNSYARCVQGENLMPRFHTNADSVHVKFRSNFISKGVVGKTATAERTGFKPNENVSDNIKKNPRSTIAGGTCGIERDIQCFSSRSMR